MAQGDIGICKFPYCTEPVSRNAYCHVHCDPIWRMQHDLAPLSKPKRRVLTMADLARKHISRRRRQP